MTEETIYATDDKIVMARGEITQHIDKENWSEIEAQGQDPFNEMYTGGQQTAMINSTYLNQINHIAQQMNADRVAITFEQDYPLTFSIFKENKEEQLVGEIMVAPMR